MSGTATGHQPAPTGEVLFAGDLPDYGQTLSEGDTALLAYMRALRRVDPCGLMLALKDIGAPTYISGDVAGCFGSIKVAGTANPSSVGLSLLLGDFSLEKPEFTVGATPIYHTSGTCLYEFPIALDKLPNAPKLTGARKPALRVIVVDGARNAMSTNCKLAKPVINVLVKMPAADLPMRDALSAYPIKIAERDPCQILDQYRGRLHELRPSFFGDPFSCRFSLRDSDTWYDLSFRAGVDPPAKLHAQIRDGIEYFNGEDHTGSMTACTSMARLGRPLYARDVPGGAIQETSSPERVFIEAMSFSMKDRDCGGARSMIDKAVEIFRASFD